MSITNVGTRPVGYFGTMGMSSVGSTTMASGGAQDASTPSSGCGTDSVRSDFAAMLQAIRAGDMPSAQSALTSLQSDLPATSAAYSPTSTTATANPGQTDLDALFQAVKSGNASDAQNALTKLQSDMQQAGGAQGAQATPKAHGGHGHHHHHHGGGLESAVATALASTQSSAQSSTQSPTQPSA